MSELAGKVAVVTGGSRGIGAAIVKRLAARGAFILFGYVRSHPQAQRVREEIEQAGGRAIAFCGDLSNPLVVRELFKKVESELGGLDILVNNAGVADFCLLDNVDSERFDRVFAINVRAPILAMAESGRLMRQDGRIINISSMVAKSAEPEIPLYSASKAALETATRSAASYFGPRGITVNAVAPGATHTDMLEAFFDKHPFEKEKMIQSTPLRRIGRPEDIADIVEFLVSEKAKWITGQIIAASGGR